MDAGINPIVHRTAADEVIAGIVVDQARTCPRTSLGHYCPDQNNGAGGKDQFSVFEKFRPCVLPTSEHRPNHCWQHVTAVAPTVNRISRYHVHHE